MAPSLSDIRKSCFSKCVWLLVLQMVVSSLCAQEKQGLPDSIAVDSVVTEQIAAPPDSAKISQGDTASQAQEEFSPDSVIFRPVPSSEIRRYKSDPDLAYANDPRYWKKEQAAEQTAFDRSMVRVLSSVWFKWFIYCLLGGVLVFAIYKIVSGNRLYLFYKPSKATSATVKDEEADIYDEDLDAKIATAIGQNDFRMGTRYLFLKTLRVLNDRGLIRFHAQSTNQEYTEQLKDHSQGRDFKFLAYAYEHVWYGERPLSEEQFKRLAADFGNFYGAVGSL